MAEIINISRCTGLAVQKKKGKAAKIYRETKREEGTSECVSGVTHMMSLTTQPDIICQFRATEHQF